MFSEEIVAPPAFDSSRILVPDFITPYSSLGSVVGAEVTPVSAYMDVTSNELVFKDAANFGRYRIDATGVASAIPEEFIASVDFSFGDSTTFPYFTMSTTIGNVGSNSFGVAFSTHAGVIGGVGANEMIIYFDGITLASASFAPPRVGTLSLELKNGQITASVNGSPVISVSDSFPAIDPNPLSYFFSYWPFSYFEMGARCSSTETELHTTPTSGSITGASLFFPSLVGVRLISANQPIGSPAVPGVGRPTFAFQPIVALAGNIPSQEAFGALDATPAALSSGDMLFHLDGSLSSIGSIDATYGGTLETSPTKFGSGSMSGFASLSSPTTFPAIDGDFNLDFWIYIPTGSDYASVSFGESYNLYLFSNTGDSFGDFEPSLTISTAAVMLYRFSPPTNLIGPSGLLTMDAFNHIEISRTGTTWRLFLNGVIQGTSTDATINSPGNGVTFSLDTGMVVDEVRIQFGTGGHTSNFTPPTAPY